MDITFLAIELRSVEPPACIARTIKAAASYDSPVYGPDESIPPALATFVNTPAPLPKEPGKEPKDLFEGMEPDEAKTYSALAVKLSGIYYTNTFIEGVGTTIAR